MVRIGKKLNFLLSLLSDCSHLAHDEPSAELTQDVVVSHQEGLVDFRLSEPALLLRGEEDLDGHPLAPPLAHPHLPIPALPDLLDHLDLLGDGSLHLQKQ